MKQNALHPDAGPAAEGGPMPAAARTRSGPRGAETRAALLAAGTEIFARRGFDGASVRAITAEAGVNLGAVTYHFGSKRGLYAAVLRSHLSPMVERVGGVAAKEVPPMERLMTVVDVFFDHLGRHPVTPRLLLQEIAAGKPPPTEVVTLLQRNVGFIVGILTEGMEDGSIRQGHPLFTALSVVSQPIYLTLVAPLARAVGGVDLQDPATRARAAEHVKTFVRAGLQPPEESHA